MSTTTGELSLATVLQSAKTVDTALVPQTVVPDPQYVKFQLVQKSNNYLCVFTEEVWFNLWKVGGQRLADLAVEHMKSVEALPDMIELVTQVDPDPKFKLGVSTLISSGFPSGTIGFPFVGFVFGGPSFLVKALNKRFELFLLEFERKMIGYYKRKRNSEKTMEPKIGSSGSDIKGHKVKKFDRRAHYADKNENAGLNGASSNSDDSSAHPLTSYTTIADESIPLSSDQNSGPGKVVSLIYELMIILTGDPSENPHNIIKRQDISGRPERMLALRTGLNRLREESLAVSHDGLKRIIRQFQVFVGEAASFECAPILKSVRNLQDVSKLSSHPKITPYLNEAETAPILQSNISALRTKFSQADCLQKESLISFLKEIKENELVKKKQKSKDKKKKRKKEKEDKKKAEKEKEAQDQGKQIDGKKKDDKKAGPIKKKGDKTDKADIKNVIKGNDKMKPKGKAAVKSKKTDKTSKASKTKDSKDPKDSKKGSKDSKKPKKDKSIKSKLKKIQKFDDREDDLLASCQKSLLKKGKKNLKKKELLLVSDSEGGGSDDEEEDSSVSLFGPDSIGSEDPELGDLIDDSDSEEEEDEEEEEEEDDDDMDFSESVNLEDSDNDFKA